MIRNFMEAENPFSHLRLFSASVTAAAAVVTAGVAVYNAVQSYDQGNRDKERLDLEKEQAKQSAENDLLSVQQGIADLQSGINQNAIDIAEAQSKASGYQTFLDRYGDYYAAQTTSAQAGIAELETSGKAQYESLMQTLGYADALAGATGRASAGTSMAEVGQKAQQNVKDYVGEDMTFDANGGLYGLQRNAAGLNYDQLLLDLEAERSEASSNLDIQKTSLTSLQDTKTSLEESLALSESRASDLEAWIQETF